jgi:MFS superfamily sulfate permease-like transporter
MMIEVMPFLHIICKSIEDSMVGADRKAVLATIMAAYAMSCVITGLVFLFLGLFKLGNLIQFFPRHILIGCIGGIGLFLLATGIEVTAEIKPALSLDVIRSLFSLHVFKIWGSCVAVALCLKGLQAFVNHPLLVPLFYITVPCLFYLIAFLVGTSTQELRDQGWLFDIATVNGQASPFWEFWTYYDFSIVKWSAVMGMPRDCVQPLLTLQQPYPLNWHYHSLGFFMFLLISPPLQYQHIRTWIQIKKFLVTDSAI